MFEGSRPPHDNPDDEGPGQDAVPVELPPSNLPSYSRFMLEFSVLFPQRQLSREEYSRALRVMEELANLPQLSEIEEEDETLIDERFKSLCENFEVPLALVKEVMGVIINFQFRELSRPKGDPLNN